MIHSDRVSHCIEILCQKGCREVWCIIDGLERGAALPEIADLTDRELAEVLRELKSIMAVYDGKCSGGIRRRARIT
ncbi:MAG: hypothetical protein KJ558_13105 [Gammaproteobacteria bacterium]|nr:hypothetical protein [Gammaproteobacteria bacterium]MBU1960699.1 hypothetical protein [Gammaproteobacteria bacterium]